MRQAEPHHFFEIGMDSIYSGFRSLFGLGFLEVYSAPHEVDMASFNKLKLGNLIWADEVDMGHSQ